MPRAPWTWRVVFRVSTGVRIILKAAALWGGQLVASSNGLGISC